MSGARTSSLGVGLQNRNRYWDRKGMTLGHEKLEVFRLLIDYVAWGFAQAKELNAGRGYCVKEGWMSDGFDSDSEADEEES